MEIRGDENYLFRAYAALDDVMECMERNPDRFDAQVWYNTIDDLACYGHLLAEYGYKF